MLFIMHVCLLLKMYIRVYIIYNILYLLIIQYKRTLKSNNVFVNKNNRITILNVYIILRVVF